MKRFAGVATLCLVITLCARTAAYAQTTTASGSSTSGESRIYVEVNAGPTLGHKSDAFVGVEGGYRIIPGLDVFVEGGHMGNVGNTQLETDAATVATFIGGTVSSTAIKVNYFDAGLRYHLNMIPVAHPYVLGGVGLAHTTREVAWEINGSPVDPATLGVQLGGDLTGSTNKTMIVVGFGFNFPFMERFFADVGYRYGQILAKTDEVETDKSLKTQRIIFGAGIRF
jgi:opacity protein-like surface antigen